ncbi:MAG: hypothetical protein COZ51_05260 [Candidatus Aquicultor secundus]|nr:MAG: hypothetical protein COZ51_05260 [Candidatus Aquicultor secundus]
MSQGQRLTAEEELQHGHLPDPEAQAIKCLGDRIRELEQKIDELAKQQNAPSLRLVAEDSADGESTTCDLDMEPVKEEGI